MREYVKQVESVPIRVLHKTYGSALSLELVAGKSGLGKVIREKSVNRPALALTGYLKYFAHKRLQLFGAGEMGYLRHLKESEQFERLRGIAQKNIPCMVVSRNLLPTKSMVRVAEEMKVPLFRTPLTSKDFSAQATIFLDKHFAPRTSIHGTLLDIKGIGTMIRGKSGVGKSECALALIERGHSLVVDDLVRVRLQGERELVGFGTDLSRGYMECRGIGIINITELFGVRSVRLQKRIDLIITFTEWYAGMPEERTGLEQNYYRLLGIDVPHIEIPVRPGRDMARLVEAASMVQALKLMGHDSALEFNERLIAHMAKESRK